MHTTQTAQARTDRRPLASRDVVVTERERVTEHMLRLTLGGNDLVAIVHDSPGAWIKLFIDEPDGFGEHGRAYTVRGFDPVRDEITIDVFLHGGGTVPRWAQECGIGSPARIGGPRPSGAPGGAATAIALFGDETSLPAIAAILEREHSHRPAQAFIEVSDARDRQELDAPGGAAVTWLPRARGEAPGAQLLAAAGRTTFTQDMGVWFAGEAASAHWFRRRLRAETVAELHVQGYWRSGVGDYRE